MDRKQEIVFLSTGRRLVDGLNLCAVDDSRAPEGIQCAQKKMLGALLAKLYSETFSSADERADTIIFLLEHKEKWKKATTSNHVVKGVRKKLEHLSA